MKINKIALKGFRSFKDYKEIELSPCLTLIYGDNSHGKTGLAEAIEFLFSGATTRRELRDTSKPEFKNSLKNVFLGEEEETFIDAWLTLDNSSEIHIRRTLISDYPNTNENCISKLEMERDGNWVDFSFPDINLQEYKHPENVPIIFQHTLRHVILSSTEDRRRYFRKLLDIDDLYDVREIIRQSIDDFTRKEIGSSEDWEYFNKLRSLTEDQDMDNLKRIINGSGITLEQSKEVIIDIIDKLLSEEIEDYRIKDENYSIKSLQGIIASYRAKVFDTSKVKLGSLGSKMILKESWPEVVKEWLENLKTKYKNYSEKNEIIDSQVEILYEFYKTGIELPQFKEGIKQNKDCPFCLTKEAVSEKRIQDIRSLLEKPKVIKNIRKEMNDTLQEIYSKVNYISKDIKNHIPKELLDINIKEVEQISPEDSLFDNWNNSYKKLVDSFKKLKEISSSLITDLDTIIQKVSKGNDIDISGLIKSISVLSDSAVEYLSGYSNYCSNETELSNAVNEIVDNINQKKFLNDLLEVYQNLESINSFLAQHNIKEDLKEELKKSLATITKTNHMIFNEKYADLTKGISDWWETLRPDEPVRFDRVAPRGSTARFIDIKASILPDSAIENIERDAIGIFSDSQLNCFGLSTFIARTLQENSGIIIFDDPIQSLDREHADLFTTKAIEKIINDYDHQLILFTHDYEFWNDLKTFYISKNPKMYHIRMSQDIYEGSMITDVEDSLQVALSILDMIIRIDDDEIFEISTNKIRSAAEIFCKELICKNTMEMPSKYDGKTLGDLIPKVESFLTKDPSHPGKLRYIERRTNTGSHDCVKYAPRENALKVMFGDLKKLKKDYNL